MSRWLKSVNNLLETLDGQVEDVVDDALDDIRGSANQEFSDDDYDSDDDESEYESEELESEMEEEQIVWGNQEPEEPLFEKEIQPFEVHVAANTDAVTMESFEADVVVEGQQEESEPTSPPPPLPEISQEKQKIEKDQEISTADKPTVCKEKETVKTPVPEEPVALEKPQPAPPAAKPRPPPPPPPAQPKSTETAVSSNTTRNAPPAAPKTAPVTGLMSSKTVVSPPASGYASAPTSTREDSSNVQQQLKRSNRELKKVQAEARQLRKHVMQLNSQLEIAEAEMAAQRQELQRAAERMEKDRARNNEEREDLLDEHEEELEQLKEHYEKLLAEQKVHYEDQVEDLQERLSLEEEKRMQEGGDWTQELEDSMEREREALKRLSEMKEEHAALQSKTTKLEAQQNALQKKLESSAQNFQTASQREREAEDKLDAALSLHSRQLSQRQAREAELERMIADLGAALTVARQKEQNKAGQGASTTSPSIEGDAGYRKKYELAVDELETIKVQLSMESQRCEALRQELHDITQERTEETYEAQARQQQHDREIADLNANVSRLEANLRDMKKTTSATGETTGEVTPSNEQTGSRQSKEVEELKKKVASLSEQAIRLQDKNDRFKTEILAMKNRLQASNARAESAEQALAAAPPASTTQMYQAEAGVSYASGIRRRIKGGRGRSSTSVRSMRSALNMRPGQVGECTEQVAVTIDALDSFLVETGSYMRHEPLARFAFLMYLIVLHLWAFCLVLFHSFEKEHGDFGSLSEMGGVPGEGAHP